MAFRSPQETPRIGPDHGLGLLDGLHVPWEVASSRVLVENILADTYRVTGRKSWTDVARQLVVGETTGYVVAFRLASAARSAPVKFLTRLWLRVQRRRHGINLPWATQVGPGLLIGHAGGIVVNAAVTIGANCNLSHNVTIGVSRGRNAGTPVIGDEVYIGPGAVLIGNIRVGDGAAIGANAVVVKDVPAGHTAVGNPATVRPGGSANYINRVWPTRG